MVDVGDIPGLINGISGHGTRDRTYRNTCFFRHEGKEVRTVYFRINPTAIRFTQANKGSVADTLGGYFREVMYSSDPQRNGLMLPDLTIEAETGIAYRDEVNKLKRIWELHGERKSDGTPADTYFFDYAGQQFETIRGVKSYEPRAFKVEILNFGWDDSVQDPFRMRFNFRCKVLQDLYGDVDQSKRKLKKLIEAGKLKDKGQGLDIYDVPILDGITGAGLGAEGLNTQALTIDNAPLDVGGQTSMIQQSLGNLPLSFGTFTGSGGGNIQQILSQVLQTSGLGSTKSLQRLQELGKSVFGRGTTLYPSGSQTDLQNIIGMLSGLLGDGLPEIPELLNGTLLQGGPFYDGSTRPESEAWVDDLTLLKF